MSDYDAIDYVPIIGDIYRYAKIGYKQVVGQAIQEMTTMIELFRILPIV